MSGAVLSDVGVGTGALPAEVPDEVLVVLSEHLAAAGRVHVYRGATVVDGTGAPRFVADVVVEGRRITHVLRGGLHGVLPGGVREIAAQGLVLAPGFIDMHAHSDLAVLRGADHDAKILQGVTTEVIGQDGIAYAPVDDAAALVVARQIAGWNGPITESAYSWRSVDDYLDLVDERTAANVAMLVPQGNLRLLTVGHEPRPATPGELGQMRAILAESMRAGAFGMSSGLTYAPGMHASTDELAALCEVVAEYDGFWAPHTRGYGGGALEAFAEVLDIGRRTGCAIHLTHATMNFAANRGRAGELLALVDAALDDGVDVTLDTYPYLPGSTTLAALLPSTLGNGGDLLGALRGLAADDRERLRVELEELGCDGFHGERADWTAIQIAGVGSGGPRELVGRTIAEIADASRRRPIDVVVDTLIADELATSVLMHVGDEHNVQQIMRHRMHAGGSDGILIGDQPHPRGHGTFARYLGYYTRELGVLGLEEAVRHLSGTPARRLGLDRDEAPRGVIRPGAIADLVLFDPSLVADGATFEAPRTPPTGFAEVLIAGEPVVTLGRVTGRAPGRALRHALPPHLALVPRVDRVGESDAHDAGDAPGWFVLDGHVGVEIADEARDVAETVLTELRAATGLALAERTLAPGMPGTPSPHTHGPRSLRFEIDPALAAGETPRLPGGAHEAFRVMVTPDTITVAGASPAGVFRGATVLRQLLGPAAWAPLAERYRTDAAPAVTPSTPGSIRTGVWASRPAMGWRGLMLDVARHFRPVDEILRVIELMAMHHLNVLHLHLSDDQGWRFEVERHPRLTSLGGRRERTQLGHGPNSTVVEGVHEGWYSHADVRRIVQFAASRFVTVVPEIEVPAHVQAALAAYPELGNLDVTGPHAPDAPWSRFGINRHTLNIEEATVTFFCEVLDELAAVFSSPWIGLGGDEAKRDEWAASPRIAERMRELGLPDVAAVQPWFMSRLAAHLRSLGRTPFAWDEAIDGVEVWDTPPTVATWRGRVAQREALRRGLDVVACDDLFAYLDYRQSDSPDEPIPVGPPLTLRGAYDFDPLGMVGAEGLSGRVLGGQACLWTEHVPDRGRLDFMAFPRLCAIAERLWAANPPDFASFERRMQTHELRLAAAGVEFRADDGPSAAQRRPGVSGAPITRAARERIVAELVAELAVDSDSDR